VPNPFLATLLVPELFRPGEPRAPNCVSNCCALFARSASNCRCLSCNETLFAFFCCPPDKRFAKLSFAGVAGLDPIFKDGCDEGVGSLNALGVDLPDDGAGEGRRVG